MNEENFVIFATDHMGDTLVLGELIYNIKKNFNNANICLVVYKQWEYIANLIESIDKIVVFDKQNKHKGFSGAIKLKKSIGYKNIYASFITFRRQRPIFISQILNSKYVLFNDINFFFNTFLRKTKYKIHSNNNIHITTDTAMLLNGITNNSIEHIKIALNKSKIITKIFDFNPNEYIAINPIGEAYYKNLDFDKLKDLISFFNKIGKKIILLGHGTQAQMYSNELSNCNLSFINLINKTDIEDLVYLISKIKGLISVDTGTAHLGTYIGTNTIWLNRGTYNQWEADSIYSNAFHINMNLPSEDIFKNIIKNNLFS